MRTVLMAAAMLAAGLPAGLAAGAADAQGRMAMPGPGYPQDRPMPPPSSGAYPGQGYGSPGQPYPNQTYPGPSYPGQHWGGQYRGHWIGGMRAPGGWGAYRRPRRGAVLPGYWRSPDFALAEWHGYGLPQPPFGYRWTRYYDDAVLIDGAGTVYDRVAGLDWRRYDLDEAQGGRLDAYYANRDSYAGAYDEAGASYGYPADGGVPPGYAPTPVAGYPAPGFAPPAVVQTGGGTVVTTSTAGGVAGGTYVNGYYYPPAAVTTVTVASTPVVTTTTEAFDDVVTYHQAAYHAPAVRKAYRRRAWRRPAPVCYCR